MLIPATMKELLETYSFLGHAPRQQAITCKASGLLHVRAIKVFYMLGFVGNIHQLRNASLHPKSKFILRNPSRNFWISRRGLSQAIQFRDRSEDVLL